MCDCQQSNENCEDYLLECTIYNAERNILLQNCREILNSDEISTEALLLSDSTGDTKEQRHRVIQVFTNYIIMTNMFPLSQWFPTLFPPRTP